MERIPRSRDSNNDRTAEWVVAQEGQAYDSLPPSPTFAPAAMRHAPSSNRTTASSEQSLAASSVSGSRRREKHASSSQAHASPVPNYSAAAPPHRTSHSSREQTRLPFPQSPPGSGYPLMLQVAPPRAEADRSQTKPVRPSLIKKRRPSLIDQIKAIGAPGGQGRRDDSRK